MRAPGESRSNAAAHPSADELAEHLILEGAMTIASEGDEHTNRASEFFAISAGCRYRETAGLEGVQYLAGRRIRAAANGN